MSAAHFGATIEAIQRAYRENHPEKFDAKLIDQTTKWGKIRSGLEKVIKDGGLPSDKAEIFLKKISNLNEMPGRMVSDMVMADIGISLNGIETDAWKRWNAAAHGGEISQESMLRNIRETKLLRLIFHRILLKITGASDTYNNDFTIGHSIRMVTESIPDS